jgi:DNA-binding CsgD family transcriptional regulator/PAS domain-containing protein
MLLNSGPHLIIAMDEKALWAVIDRIYHAVEQPELWPDTISAVGACIGGAPHFWGVERGSLDSGWSCRGTVLLSRADLEELERYEDEFGELIVRFLRIVFLSVLWSQNEVAAREAIGLRVAQRYLQAAEPLNATSRSPLRPRRRLLVALWEDGHAFTSENVRAMRALAPHLDRALRLQMRLNAAEFRVSLISGALDNLTIGVILINRSGSPLWINRRGQDIMKHSDVLRVSSDGLIGRCSSETQALRQLIKGAISSRAQGILAMNRDSHDLRPLLLIASPLDPIGTTEPADEVPCAVVFISDPDRIDTPSVESLKRAFKLTNREAQMAIAIARGHGLQAAANTMGIAVTTAKSQLKQAFVKTGTQHQAELAALVSRTLSHIRYN